MALVVKDRVRETSTSTGTGAITLNGAVAGFQGFSVIGDGNTTYYTIVDAATGAWEVGIGTYTLVGSSLSRDTVLESSNNGNKVDFAVGTKDVFVTYPAEKSVDSETPQTLTNKTLGSGTTITTSNATITGGTINNTAIGGTTPAAGAFTSVSASLPSVISVNSSSDALRITQTGSGNALVVEDSANPDSTPFVVNADGNVIIGGTTALGTGLSLVNSGSFTPVITSRNTTADSGYTYADFQKSRAGAIVQSGDGLGGLIFSGFDGAAQRQAGAIVGAVDGTPGTNDMPGRLVLSTTADGASSPTERMRIDSAGRVGIGGIDSAGVLTVGKTLTGLGTGPAAFVTTSTINSDATGSAKGFQTYISTQAASFNLSTLSHFTAQFGTLGAGSSITAQRGFEATSGLTGATNNYGFYSNIASGTGRWNFYAAGSADNYFAGPVKLNTTSGGSPLTVQASSGNYAIDLQQNSTNNAVFIRFLNNAFSSTVSSISSVGSDLYFSTSAAERLRITATGNVGIGTTTPGSKLAVNGSITESVDGTNYFPVVTQRDIGTAPNQIPLNQYLGSMAYEDNDSVNITGGTLSNVSLSASLPSVISVNSSSDALRITQTGAGNALVVEDSANPDATPFVVNASGFVGIGTNFPVGPLDVSGDGFNSSTYFRAYGASAGSYQNIIRGRGTQASPQIVVSGDALGGVAFSGYDGVSSIAAALIRADVDGTPGTNDMPGRLVFLTTADGASSPTERMRIDNAGRVGIGGAPNPDSQFVIQGTYTSSAGYTFVDRALGTIPSTSTTGAVIRQSELRTQAASFTLPFVYYNQVSQSSIGAGSTVTNQMGYVAEGNLTGATNNYGFWSNIASGTGRWNFYAAGSAANYFAGNVGIGTTGLNAKFGVVQAAQQATGSFINTATSWATDVQISYQPSGVEVGALTLSARLEGDVWISANYGPLRFRSVTGGGAAVTRLSVKPTGQTRFHPLSADPSGAEAGDVYYNSSTNKLRVYNGTSWVDLH